MAGNEDSQYPGDSSGAMRPELQSFVGQFDTDEGRGWAQEAAGKVQDYLTTQAVARENQAAGDALVNNLHDTKTNLLGMVQKDPHSADLALDLAHITVNGLVDQHGEDAAGSAQPIVDHMQSEIAHTAVQRFAEIDRPTALDALDRYGHLIPDDQQDALRTYADHQEVFRGQDAQAQMLQQQRDAGLAGYGRATEYLGGLYSKDNGQLQFPPGYAAQLMADPGVATPTKLALHAGYQMLQRNGDVPQSNPDVLTDLIGRIGSGSPPQQGEIVSHLGTNLSVADAAFLNNMIAPQNPAQSAVASKIADTVQQARDTLASPVNGAAGQAAYSRFTGWLMNGLHQGGDPGELMADNRIQQFAPTAADYRAAIPTGPRLPLHNIFAGDVAPLRPGNPTGEDFNMSPITDRMREMGITGYSLPGQLPVTFPNTAPAKPANEAKNRGGTSNV